MGLIMKNEIKITNELAKIKHKCNCGHTVIVPHRVDFVYCDYCFKRVYRSDFMEFKHNLLRACGRPQNEQISQ